MLGVFGFVVSGYHQVVVLHAFHEWQEDVEVFLFLHLAEREEEVSVAQRLDGGGAVLSAFGQVLDAVVDDLLGLAFEVEYKAGVLLYKMGDECKFVGPVAPALHFFTVFGLFLGLFLVDEVHIVDGQYDVCSGPGGAKKGVGTDGMPNVESRHGHWHQMAQTGPSQVVYVATEGTLVPR